MLRVLLLFGRVESFIFRSVWFHSKLEQSCAWPLHAQPSLLSASSTRVVHLLQRYLHWHVLVTQSHGLSPGSALLLYILWYSDRCVITLIHHCGIIQKSFTAWQPSALSLFTPPFLHKPWNALHGFAFSRMLCNWSYVSYSLFRLASLTE